MFVNFQSDGNKNYGYVLMEVEVVNKTGRIPLNFQNGRNIWNIFL